MSSSASRLGSSLVCQDVFLGDAAMFRRQVLRYPPADLPAFVNVSASLGSTDDALFQNRGVQPQIRSHGSALTVDRALTIAAAEGIERYSSSVIKGRTLITSKASELGGESLDLDSVARLSEAELEHPLCPFVVPDQNASIRWVRGLNLISLKECWIPATMAFNHLPNISQQERFWPLISTGCAAHTSLEHAIRSAIFEVVERDAISLIWLQRIPLPRILIDCVDDELCSHLRLCGTISDAVEFHFFDAQLDLHVPTVYGVARCKHNSIIHTAIACSSAATYQSALCKVVVDLESILSALAHQADYPNDPTKFSSLFDGARYMAHESRKSAFDFLLNSPSMVRTSELRCQQCSSIREIVNRFSGRSLQVFLIDLTTDEAAKTGLRVVRAVAPALQPLSFSHLAQFKGNPRLYSVPKHMGAEAHDEEGLNKWPQPFA